MIWPISGCGRRIEHGHVEVQYGYDQDPPPRRAMPQRGRGRADRTLTAARESGTIWAPIFELRRRNLAESRSTTCQGSVWISLRRQPVSMSSRMRISAPDGVLPGRRRPYGHGSYSRRSRQAAGRSLGGGNVDNGGRTLRFRHPLSVFAQGLDVVADRLSDRPYGVFSGVSGGDATGKVGNVGCVVPGRPLDNDGVSHLLLHSFSPACFMTLAHVPRGRSSPGLPAMVTVPGLSGCRYWR